MKKVLFSLLFVAFAFAANAQSQIEQGRISLGGYSAAGFNTSLEDNGGSTFGIDAKVGYNFIEKLNGGLILGLGVVDSGIEGAESVTSWNVGPYLRYYFPVSDMISIYPEASFVLNGTSVEGSETGNTLAIGVGAAFFIGEQVSIDALLNFRSISTGIEGVDRTNALGLNVGVNVFFGN